MVDAEYPVIGSTSIIGYHNQYKVEPPGVVTGRSGSLGRVQYIKERYWPHNTCLWVKDFKGNDPLYVYYFLQTLSLAQYNTGVGVPTLNRNHLYALDIQIHDLVEQRKIACILSAYDELIENNTRRIQILEEMAQRIYRELFVDFRFPGYQETRFVDSEMGRIPERWQIGKVSDIMQVLGGYPFKSKTYLREGTYGIVTIKNVKDGLFLSSCESFINDLPKNMKDHCVLHDGDILLSLTGNVGRACLIFGSDYSKYLLNQRVAKLVTKSDYHYSFIYELCRSKEFQEKLISISTGVAQQNLSPIEMGKISIIIPEDSMMEYYSEIIYPLLNEIIILNNQNLMLRNSRDLLLAKLISGELDVSNLDIAISEPES